MNFFSILHVLVLNKCIIVDFNSNNSKYFLFQNVIVIKLSISNSVLNNISLFFKLILNKIFFSTLLPQ